ncbi:MAG: hypothetical protein IJ244_05990 [Bacteroidaceae bacterium]|nr:hypothetical protein [Bacteroidaceae bacterium]
MRKRFLWLFAVLWLSVQACQAVGSGEWPGKNPWSTKEWRTYASRPEQGYENFRVYVDYEPQKEGETHSVYADYGVIALPDNYSPDGEPVRLIVFCQGTGERTQATTNPLNNHGWKYFLAKGYAVMDMNGYSFAWASHRGLPVVGQHYAHKSLLDSYKKGYDYVMQKYNLKKEVLLMGLSMGGGASFMLAHHAAFPIVAQVGFCPALSLFKQNYMKPWGGTKQQITIAGQWGFPEWDTTAPDMEYFLQNWNLVDGYENLFYRVRGDDATVEAAKRNYGNEAEREAFAKLAKPHPCPLKIWHCMDDATVLFRYSEYVVNMIKNAGGKAELRPFQKGGHGGGWLNNPVTDTDIHGNPINVSTNFKEALEFLKQYE